MPRIPCLSSLENIAITGATGFIGSHLVRLLVSSGCRPTLLGRPQKFGGPQAAFEGMARWVQCDLTDGDSIREAIQKARPHIVFHLAGTRGRSATDCAVLNFYGTARLLEIARENQVRRIVIAGSAEEYGDQPGPLGEGFSLKPCTAYGISKAIATKHALALYARDNCPVVVVRPFSVYGPCQPAKMFVAQAIEAAVRNVPFKMSPGEQKRDLIFVEDVAKGFISAAIAPGVEGKVINLGTGRPYRLREVAGRVWELTGSNAPLLVGALEPEPEELCDTWADIDAARELLGWQPEVDLDDGLRRTISFARAQYGDKVQLCQMA